MIKLDIISGFLGAGKTTLIKKLLTACAKNHERIVLIENEFGEIGIDGTMVRKDGFEVYELSQGCVCCSLKSDFLFTLSEIIHKLQPDRILFEPSGIFVLSEIFSVLKTPEISEKCSLNSIITVVDCVNFLKQRHKYTFFFSNQISHSNKVVLSKTQLVPQEDVAAVTQKITAMNSAVEILSLPWNDLTLEKLLQILDMDLQKLTESLQSQSCGCSDACGSHHHHAHHHIDFESFGIRTPKSFTHEELAMTLGKLKNPEFGEIVRAKGFIRNGNDQLEFNYVNGQFDIVSSQEKVSSMVSFIGTSLNREWLSQYFQ